MNKREIKDIYDLAMSVENNKEIKKHKLTFLQDMKQTIKNHTGLFLLLMAFNTVIITQYLLLFWGKEINELFKHF